MLKALVVACAALSFSAYANVSALTYSCPNNHTVDVFGQPDGQLSVSVDGKKSLEYSGGFTLPASDSNHSDVNMAVFGLKDQPLRLIIAQSVENSGSVTISYVNNNVEQWAYNCRG